MPFTDAQLANQMATELVESGLMTQNQLNTFMLNQIMEVNVDAINTVTTDRFTIYWGSLSAWLQAEGGNANATSSGNIPGRLNPYPQETPHVPLSLYGDCFYDVVQAGENNDVGKAVANHLRFVKVIYRQQNA